MQLRFAPSLSNPFRASIGRWMAALIGVDARLRRWVGLARERRDLAKLDERMLRDIGINRYDAAREARRKFWDDPSQRYWF